MSSQEIDIDEATDSVRSTYIVSGLVVVVAILAFGAVGYLTGTGWFGYRQWLYGEGELYLANYSDQTRQVSVDGRTPVTLEPRTFEVVQLVGGTSSVRILEESGDSVATHEIFTDRSDAYLRVAGDACLTAADVSSFYKPGDPKLEVSEYIDNDQDLYVPGSHNVIWPGKDFPPKLETGAGPGIWLEKVGCNHLENPGHLRAYLRVRLRDRLGRDRVPERSGPPWKDE